MDKTPKIWLDETETANLLAVAKRHRYRDYLILTLCRYGLRDGEILGRGKLPGIRVRDLREDGVWMVGKGYSHQGEAPSLYPLSRSFAKELIDFSVEEGGEKDRKLFDLSVRQLARLIKTYAKEAGIRDWEYVRPHRLRAFFRDQSKSKGLIGIPDSGHDATSRHIDDKSLCGKNGGDGETPGHGVTRRFWVLGMLAALLFYHSYGILSGIYSDLDIVTYDQAIILGVLEALIAPVLTVMFLWKTVVWQHDRPKGLRHVFDDPNILD